MIRNSEDANKYYQLVNQYVDDYIEEFIKKHKFKPSRVESYLLENKAKLKKSKGNFEKRTKHGHKKL